MLVLGVNEWTYHYTSLMDWYGHLPSFLSSGIVIKFQGEPISGEVKYTGGGILQLSLFTSETV